MHVITSRLSQLIPSSMTLLPSIKSIALVNTLACTSLLSNKVTILSKFDPTLLSFFISSLLVSIQTRSLSSLSSSILPKWIEVAAWEVFLQASLILGLWNNNDSNNTSNSNSNSSSSITLKSIPFGYAFIMGCIGSLLGGLISYKYKHSSIYNILSPSVIAACTACLVSSYIGGTVNFFETGKQIISSSSTTSSSSINNSIQSTINLVAGLDIGIMVMFFTLLRAIRDSPIKKWLVHSNNNSNNNKNDSNNNSSINKQDQVEAVSSSSSSSSSSSNISKRQSLTNILSVLLPVGLSIGLTFIGSSIQSVINIPGISVSIVIVLGLLLKRLDRLLLSKGNHTSILGSGHSKSSQYMLCLFYTIIGITTRVQDVFQLGLPLLSMIISILLIHISFILITSYIWNHFIIKKEQNLMVDIDTVIIASNACVGGASTAAAMAGSINRIDLILYGSTFGIIGYIIGTHIGLLLFKMIL